MLGTPFLCTKFPLEIQGVEIDAFQFSGVSRPQAVCRRAQHFQPLKCPELAPAASDFGKGPWLPLEQLKARGLQASQLASSLRHWFLLLFMSLVGENGLRREGKGICLKAGLPVAKSLESWFLFKISRAVGRQGRG